MRRMNEEDDLTDTWLTIGRGLAAVSALSIAAGMVIVLSDKGVAMRDRVFQACQAANTFAGLLALIAVVVLLLSNTPADRSRGVLATTQVIGGVIVVCAAYAVVYSITKHSRFPRPEEDTSFFAFVGLNWSYRMSGVLTAVANGVVGVLTIFAVTYSSAGSVATTGIGQSVLRARGA